MPVRLRNLGACLSLMRRCAPRAFYLIVAANIFAGLIPSARVHVGARLIACLCCVLVAALHVQLAHAQVAASLGEQEQRRRAQEQAIERERALEAPNVELQPAVRAEVDATAVGSTAYAVIGAATGGGMDAAGQYAQTGAIRPAQSLFAVATGAVTAPIGASTGFISNVLLGGAGAGVNTAFNNLFYGDSSSVLFASSVGATFNGAAYPIGLGLTKMTGQLLPRFVYPNGLNPNVPALLQGVRNPYPANIGAAAGSLTQGVGSFVPGKAPDGRSSSK